MDELGGARQRRQIRARKGVPGPESHRASAPLAQPHEFPSAHAPTGGARARAPRRSRATGFDHGLVTHYAHCSKILVARRTRVKRGQKIALIGSTGISTGPHLHYEVWVNRKSVNPMKDVLPDAIVD